MNSIAIGWKKKAPDAVQILNRKPRPQKKPARKTVPPKQQQRQQQQTLQTIEQYIPKAVRPNKVLADEQPYTIPLESSIFSAKPANKSSHRIPINWDNRLCSTRAAIVTFIIIFILIAASGASVGIIFAAINAKNSTGSGSNNNNNNNNQNSFTTISPGTFTSSVSIGSQTGLPCLSYTTINDPSRNYNATQSSSSCDTGPLFNASNGGAWIRFVGSGGTTIVTSAPGVQHCGGFLPGWYNGTLSTTVNLVTNGSVCLETYADECGIYIDVLALYCPGNFYIYFLTPLPICNSRYCTA